MWFHFLFQKEDILDRNFTVFIQTQTFLTMSEYVNHSVYSKQNKLKCYIEHNCVLSGYVFNLKTSTSIHSHWYYHPHIICEVKESNHNKQAQAGNTKYFKAHKWNLPFLMLKVLKSQV